ncbi:MAG: hypothetical protein JSS89_09380 [Bacteroidetes bacterium]|nr:hypothetical protein [Bacteroidota bacterium]
MSAEPGNTMESSAESKSAITPGRVRRGFAPLSLSMRDALRAIEALGATRSLISRSELANVLDVSVNSSQLARHIRALVVLRFLEAADDGFRLSRLSIEALKPASEQDRDRALKEIMLSCEPLKMIYDAHVGGDVNMKFFQNRIERILEVDHETSRLWMKLFLDAAHLCGLLVQKGEHAELLVNSKSHRDGSVAQSHSDIAYETDEGSTVLDNKIVDSLASPRKTGMSLTLPLQNGQVFTIEIPAEIDSDDETKLILLLESAKGIVSSLSKKK